MTKKLLIIIPFLTISVAHGQSEAKAIRAMFDKQLVAANSGDLKGYMATIDPATPSYAPTEKAMGTIFQSYKLKFSLESFKVTSIQAKSATVATIMVTKKISGPKFKDNRIKMTMTAVKKGGKWLLSGTKLEKIDYL